MEHKLCVGNILPGILGLLTRVHLEHSLCLAYICSGSWTLLNKCKWTLVYVSANAIWNHWPNSPQSKWTVVYVLLIYSLASWALLSRGSAENSFTLCLAIILSSILAPTDQELGGA